MSLRSTSTVFASLTHQNRYSPAVTGSERTRDGGMPLIVTFALAFLVDFGPTRGLRGMSNRLIGKISVA
ncbi:hypothetical protein [Yersinia pseudotuberculosis]|uniref:hypothetical protein n=1 Tax=Yersinia pseudotuberculosis TaxID=633 RepID=UPI001E341AC5|nr:hypothetical protein [Yersinia pseudotuberculosis]